MHAIIYDVATHSVLMLVPLDNRLTASVWLSCNMLAALQHGMPDLCARALPASAAHDVCLPAHTGDESTRVSHASQVDDGQGRRDRNHGLCPAP